MANTLTLTSLAPIIYGARDIVARELAGAVTSVTINRDGSTTAAFGDKVQSFITAQPTLNTSYTPAMTIPAADDQTVAADDFALDNVANVRIPLTGETARKLDNSFGVDVVLQDMFAQAIRRMINVIEVEVADVVYKGSSRAAGAANAVPFASDFDVLADVRKILADNGAPLSDGQLSLVANTAAGTNLRKLSSLYKVNESGSSDLLRQGELLNLLGFSIKESAGVASHTKGTGTGDTLSGTPAIGATELTFSSFADGEYVPGDSFTIADDPNIYTIKSVNDSDNKVTINAPGLRVTGVNAKAITLVANHTANIAFHRLAAELAMRAPAQPYGGDAAVDRIALSDDRTGLTFEVAQYKGYGMAMFDFTCFYGAKVWKPEFVAKLIGS